MDSGVQTRYRGPEYREAVGRPGRPLALDSLVHPDPYSPPRLYRFVLVLLRWLLPKLFRFEVEGAGNVPPAPFIVASNHQAWYDTLFILAAFPKLPMIYTMAKRETVFDRDWKRWLVTRFGVFPVSPREGELDLEAVATVYRLLARGACVLIFPEGRYSRGRELRPLKKGVAHFALQAGVPICPVAITGLDRLRPFARVRVSIGPPIRPDPPRWWDANRRASRVVEAVRLAILRGFGRQGRPDGRLARLRAWLGREPVAPAAGPDGAAGEASPTSPPGR
jgi:1-acyl-sn-glycerol-3-phosphate acyltransferase